MPVGRKIFQPFMLKLQTKTQNPLMRPRSTQPQRVLQFGQHVYQGNWDPENTKLRGSITLLADPCLFCLDSAALFMLKNSSFTRLIKSKPVKVSATVILLPMVSVLCWILRIIRGLLPNSVTRFYNFLTFLVSKLLTKVAKIFCKILMTTLK